MSEKIRKTVYVPTWVGTVLDAEGKRYGGPGTVVSAAIAMFHGLAKRDKVSAMKSYRDHEVQAAYDNTAGDGAILFDLIKNSSLPRQTKQEILAVLGYKSSQSSGKLGRKVLRSKNVASG